MSLLNESQCNSNACQLTICRTQVQVNTSTSYLQKWEVYKHACGGTEAGVDAETLQTLMSKIEVLVTMFCG